MNDVVRAYFLRQLVKRAAQKHRWDDVAKLYDALRQTGAVRPSDAVRHAKAMEVMGRKEAAERLHRDNADLFPLDSNVHRQGGLFLLRHQKESEAVLAFARARALAPSDEVLKSDLDRLGVDDGRFVAVAVAAFHAVPPPRPTRPGPVAKLLARRAAKTAKALRQSGDWTGALTAQTTVLRHNPHNASAQIRLGHVLKALGRGRDAETAYWRGVALAPKDAESYLQLAHGLKLERGLQDAVPAFLLTQKLQPGHVEAGMAVKESGLSERDGAEMASFLADGDVQAILRFTAGAKDIDSGSAGVKSGGRGGQISVFQRPAPQSINVRAIAVAGDIARAVGASL
jgi:Flp pilus assembly protein TadD